MYGNLKKKKKTYTNLNYFLKTESVSEQNHC